TDPLFRELLAKVEFRSVQLRDLRSLRGSTNGPTSPMTGPPISKDYDAVGPNGFAPIAISVWRESRRGRLAVCFARRIPQGEEGGQHVRPVPVDNVDVPLTGEDDKVRVRDPVRVPQAVGRWTRRIELAVPQQRWGGDITRVHVPVDSPGEVVECGSIDVLQDHADVVGPERSVAV